MPRGLAFSDLHIGRVVSGSVTVTAAHVTLAAGLFNDYNPLHVNDEIARVSPFGRRLVHGPLTFGLMMGTVGLSTSGTGLALLENTVRYAHPVFIGDTLYWEWRVVDRKRSSRHGGGVVHLAGRCWNQDGVTVIEADATEIVKESTTTANAPDPV